MPYEVGTWLGFRSAAISYTFDDNCPNQLAVALPMFDRYGFKLTLFAVSNFWSPNWSGLRSASLRGHEIGNHTASHPSFRKETVNQQKREMSMASDSINTQVPKQKCSSFAYPGGDEGNDSLVASYFVAARGEQGFIESSTPRNFMYISAVVCGTLGPIKSERDFRISAETVASSGGWLIYVIHGVDKDGGCSNLSSDTLRASLEYLNANREKFWTSTFGSVARYIKERNCVSVTESYPESNDTSQYVARFQVDGIIRLQVTDSLDNEIYNVPITIRRPLPPNWSSVVVKQNGLRIISSILRNGPTKYVMFDAVPNGGEIELVKETMTGDDDVALKGARNSNNNSLSQNFPNPFNPTTNIRFTVPRNGRTLLRVFNTLGQEVATLVNDMRNVGTYSVQWNASNLSSGTYYYRIQSGDLVEMKKMVLIK